MEGSRVESCPVFEGRERSQDGIEGNCLRLGSDSNRILAIGYIQHLVTTVPRLERLECYRQLEGMAWCPARPCGPVGFVLVAKWNNPWNESLRWDFTPSNDLDSWLREKTKSVEIFVLNSMEIHYFLNLYHINIYDTLFSFRETIFSIKNNNNNSTFYPLEDITWEKAIFLKYLNFSLLKLHPRKRRKKKRREKICFNRP